MTAKDIAHSNEFGKVLVDHFGLPSTTTEVRIVVKGGCPVRIECDFYAEKAPLEEIIKLTKTFNLEKE